MSRGEATRDRILEATKQLLAEVPGASPSMGQIADAARVTRQLLYFHFDSRTDLLLELSRRMDAEARSPARQARIDDAPDAVTALREAVALQGHIKPKIFSVARTIDRLRHTDRDAARVWEEREHARLGRCTDVIRRLFDEEILGNGWDIPTAAHVMWSVTSLRAWEELVVEQGWSTRAWVRHTTRLLERALLKKRA
jgi:AcrR family transcriptional regulator